MKQSPITIAVAKSAGHKLGLRVKKSSGGGADAPSCSVLPRLRGGKLASPASSCPRARARPQLAPRFWAASSRAPRQSSALFLLLLLLLLLLSLATNPPPSCGLRALLALLARAPCTTCARPKNVGARARCANVAWQQHVVAHLQRGRGRRGVTRTLKTCTVALPPSCASDRSLIDRRQGHARSWGR